MCCLSMGLGLVFLRYLWFYWSDFDKQGLIGKLIKSSNQRIAKFSCRETHDGALSRNFHVVKFSCFTVGREEQLFYMSECSCSAKLYKILVDECRRLFPFLPYYHLRIPGIHDMKIFSKSDLFGYYYWGYP